jgi:hypothetical protein
MSFENIISRVLSREEFENIDEAIVLASEKMSTVGELDVTTSLDLDALVFL